MYSRIACASAFVVVSLLIAPRPRVTQGGSVCRCLWHGNPSGDEIRCDAVDVTLTIGVAFGGEPEIADPFSQCPFSTTDVNCSGETDITDVIKVINVAYRASPVAKSFALPCPARGRGSTHGRCKSGSTDLLQEPAGTRPDCLVFEYDGVSTLVIRHVNAAFNCCIDSATADARITADSIILPEREWATFSCECLCLFDLDYWILYLPPGVYQLRVDELNLHLGSESLSTTLDLSSAVSDTLCVIRDYYPWRTP